MTPRGLVARVREAVAPKAAPDDLAAQLATAERDLAQAAARHRAAIEQLEGAIRGRQYLRTPVLKEKAERLEKAAAELRGRRDQLARQVADLEREARLPQPWREARARQRQANAAHGRAVDALRAGEADAGRGQAVNLRELRLGVEDAADEVRAADRAAANVIAADVEAAARGRAERLVAARAGLHELVGAIDAAYAELVRLAAEADRMAEDLRALGEAPPQVLNVGWDAAGLDMWRRGAARELAGSKPRSVRGEGVA